MALQIGIYAITNIESGKSYVGSTVSLKRRIQDHKSALRRGKHINPHLQNSWNKHEEDVFSFDVLEYLDDKDQLVVAEQSWMDTFRSKGIDLYNVGLAADCPMRGYEYTDEQKKKLSVSHKGLHWTKGKNSVEHNRRISAAKMGSQNALGYRWTDEQKQKLSVTMSAWWAKRREAK